MNRLYLLEPVKYDTFLGMLARLKQDRIFLGVMCLTIISMVINRIAFATNNENAFAKNIAGIWPLFLFVGIAYLGIKYLILALTNRKDNPSEETVVIQISSLFAALIVVGMFVYLSYLFGVYYFQRLDQHN